MMVHPVVSDKKFSDGCVPGQKNCICSRCGRTISEHELFVRCYESSNDSIAKNAPEYRYCQACVDKDIGGYNPFVIHATVKDAVNGNNETIGEYLSRMRYIKQSK